MSVIYKPQGKAGEYAKLAVNLYQGCMHQCSYCYAPQATFTNRDEFFTQVKPRKDIIERLTKEAKEWSKEKEPVLLSFTSDPYQSLEGTLGITRQAISILKYNDFPVKILTKGGILAQRDFDLLNRDDWFGTTLTFNYLKESRQWEPYAALPIERLKNLQLAKTVNLNTWVSLEPIISPEAVLELIEESHSYVDHYKIGKWNYDSRAWNIDWKGVVDDIVNLLEQVDSDYYLKEDLAKLVL